MHVVLVVQGVVLSTVLHVLLGRGTELRSVVRRRPGAVAWSERGGDAGEVKEELPAQVAAEGLVSRHVDVHAAPVLRDHDRFVAVGQRAGEPQRAGRLVAAVADVGRIGQRALRDPTAVRRRDEQGAEHRRGHGEPGREGRQRAEDAGRGADQERQARVVRLRQGRRTRRWITPP